MHSSGRRVRESPAPRWRACTGRTSAQPPAAGRWSAVAGEPRRLQGLARAAMACLRTPRARVIQRRVRTRIPSIGESARRGSGNFADAVAAHALGELHRLRRAVDAAAPACRRSRCGRLRAGGRDRRAARAAGDGRLPGPQSQPPTGAIGRTTRSFDDDPAAGCRCSTGCTCFVPVRCRSCLQSSQRGVASTYAVFDTPTICPGCVASA